MLLLECVLLLECALLLEGVLLQVLYQGDGSSGSFYPTGILKSGFTDPLPDESQGCIQTSFSPGLPEGMYTIKLQKQWTPVSFIHKSPPFSGFMQ